MQVQQLPEDRRSSKSVVMTPTLVEAGEEVVERTGDKYYGKRGHVLEASGFRITASSYAQGVTLPKHFHSRHHFCYVVSGKYEEKLRLNRVETRVASHLMYLPAGVTHTELHFSAGRHLMIEAPPQYWDKLTAKAETPMTLAGRETHFVMRKIHSEYLHRRSSYDLAIESLCYYLMAMMNRRAPGGTDVKALPAWLKQTYEILTERYADRLTVRTIAAEVGVEPEHLCYMFQRYFNTTLGEFQRRCRTYRAMLKLKENKWTLCEVAMQCGFADQSHFCATFRGYTGLSPAHYASLSMKH